MAKIKKHLVVNNTAQGFIALQPSFLKNFGLQLAEIGVLGTLLTMPDDWEFSIEELAGTTSDNKAEVEKIIKQLQDKGYIIFQDELVRVFDEPVMKAGDFSA